MTRWAMILGCVLCVLGAGCSSDDGDGGGSAGAAGSSAGSGAGNAGTSSTGGAGGRAGSGGSAGTAGTGNGGAGVTAGTNGGAGSGGTAGETEPGKCSQECADGFECQRVLCINILPCVELWECIPEDPRPACGSRGLPECSAGSYCDFPIDADCGRADAPGRCSVLTDVACGEIWSPVCGCDGETYSSSCHAQQAGMSIDHVGECGGAGPPPGYQCVADEGIACLIALPECVEGEVPSIDGACFGACVPIEACDCDGPEDCPNPEKYACHLSAGHCGPYTN